MKNITPIFLVGVGLLIQGCDTTGEGFHERHVQAAEDSGKAVAVSGGQSFQVSKSYDDVFQAAVTYLKKKDYTVESANKDAGQITTAMTITGGWRQTGARVEVSLIKESDAVTTVKVAVTEQHRYNALQVEPWDDPKVNGDSSAALATDMKTAL
ncbi:MAG TPA: hypothetical protein VIK53_19075 [Verrucomicrobiae bacterium]